MYLIDPFGIVPDYVNNQAYEVSGDWSDSHAWLEGDRLTIDITGERFGWAPVIVTAILSFMLSNGGQQKSGRL